MFQKTQAELLKSRLVLGKALSHPDVAKLPSVLSRPDPIQWLADELTLTFVGELLYIGLQSDDPQEVVKLVNAVTDAYMEEVVNADNNRRKRRLAELKEILNELTGEDERTSGKPQGAGGAGGLQRQANRGVQAPAGDGAAQLARSRT